MSTNTEQATGTVASSSTPTSGQKMSMFTAKTGFVIPKNKLSGSLVPMFRGGKKGAEDSVSEESNKVLQRKTKWGPDLSQDTSVRKGRALAYQVRVDQITLQLNSGTLDSLGNHDLFSDSQSASLTNENSNRLEMEKREAIGEILKLNPAYRAPADYKPLLKEEKVPIPIKDYPGFDFIGLIFGTAKDTQKRLEKETGAKIRVYGRRGNTRDEVEVTTSEGNVSPGVYEELYVHVSADTYEKVEAAVGLIELLVTPVSVNAASSSATTSAFGENENTVAITHSTMGSETSAAVNQGVAPLTVGSAPTLPQGTYQPYQRPRFPAGVNHTLPPTSGYMAPLNPSGPPLNPPMQVSAAPFSNMPLSFGPRPIMAQNPSLFNSRPQQSPVVQQQYGPQSYFHGNGGVPRNPPMPALQLALAQSNSTIPAQYPINQITPMGSHPMVRSVIPLFPQSTPPAVFPNTHPGVAINRQTAFPSSNSPPQSQTGFPAPASSLVQSSSTMVPTSPNLGTGSTSIPVSQPPSNSGFPSAPTNLPNFSTIKPPPVVSPRPQQPSSSDFTFQPHRPQAPVPQMLFRTGGQPFLQNMPPRNQMMHGPNYQSPFHDFQGPRVSIQINQPRAQVSTNFTGGSARPPVPLTHPAFSNQDMVLSPSLPQTQPRNFNLAPPVHPTGPLPPKAGNQLQFQQNFPAPVKQPQNLPGPNHQSSNNFIIRPPGPPRAHHVYDPFLPTSMSFNPQLNSDRVKVQKQESDPEYEDLMASVGVK